MNVVVDNTPRKNRDVAKIKSKHHLPKSRCKCSNRDSCYSWTCLCSLVTRPVMHPRASSPNPGEVYPLVIQQLTYHLSVCVRYLRFAASQYRGGAISPHSAHNGLWLGHKTAPYVCVCARKLSITCILRRFNGLRICFHSRCSCLKFVGN